MKALALSILLLAACAPAQTRPDDTVRLTLEEMRQVEAVISELRRENYGLRRMIDRARNAGVCI